MDTGRRRPRQGEESPAVILELLEGGVRAKQREAQKAATTTTPTGRTTSTFTSTSNLENRGPSGSH